MASLNKTTNGLLFFEDFSEKTLMWTLSPSDASSLSFGEEGLQMTRTRRYVTYTIVEPSTDEYSCILKLDHIPTESTDTAGLLVMSNTKEYAECQSYLATGPSELGNAEDVYLDIENMVKGILAEEYVKYEEITDKAANEETTTEEASSNEEYIDEVYQYIKFTKVKYKYIFYASKDSIVWIEIGNVKFKDSGVIGLFLYGSTDDEVLALENHCIFNTFALYSSKYITIDGIDRQYEMEIRDGDGNVLIRTDSIQYSFMISRSSKTCIINTTTLPTPIQNGTLRVYPKTNYEVTISEFDLGAEVYGGDGFALESDLELFIDNVSIDQDTEYDLGNFYRGSYFVKLDIHNNEEYSVNDITVKVIRYSEYFGGEEEVYLSVESDGIEPEDLLYEKEVIIGKINPSEGKSVYLKLMDKPMQNPYMTANSYKFKIIIE